MKLCPLCKYYLQGIDGSSVGQGEQLRLLDVQPSDNGVYKCLVNNGFGPTVRAYVTVNVACE